MFTNGPCNSKKDLFILKCKLNVFFSLTEKHNDTCESIGT